MMKVEQSIMFTLDQETHIRNHDEMREFAFAQFDKEFPGFRERHGNALDIQQFEFDWEPLMQVGVLRPSAFICRATFRGILR